MKALRSITIVAVLLAAGSFAQAGDMTPTRTFDLRFDGYCDGMRLTINYGTGVVTGNTTGCLLGDPVRGYAGAVSGGTYGGQGVVVGVQPVGWPNGIMFVISDTPRTWQVRDLPTGVVINSGTWSLGVPPPEDHAAPASCE
jgi:hypothetical protein